MKTRVFTRKNNRFSRLYDMKLRQTLYTTSQDGLTCPNKYRSQFASQVVTDACQTIQDARRASWLFRDKTLHDCKHG